ncbi:hypothetical protein, partial [Candidatus Magnetaquicoccus inordinatus]|uniref:hypothetical protein n=1 Tax=Candidatus Magnetaquicoccus inordinatus TaxID=2496818 RepID=UPI001D0EAB27
GRVQGWNPWDFAFNPLIFCLWRAFQTKPTRSLRRRSAPNGSKLWALARIFCANAHSIPMGVELASQHEPE